MFNILEKFLPDNIAEEEKTGFRVLQYYLCFTILACFVLGIAQWLMPYGDDTPFFLIGLINILFLLGLKYTAAKNTIGNIYIAIWAVILANLSLDTGGIYSMDAVSLSLVPLIGFALVNYKSSIFWLLSYFAFLYYLWAIIDSPEKNDFFRAQIMEFDKDYYLIGCLSFAVFAFCLFFFFYFQNKKLLQQLKDNQTILRDNVAKLDKQSALLKKAQTALKRSNIELEEFAYVTSHDLKQPLQTVHNFANLLQNHLDRKKVLDKDSTQMLQFIIAGSLRMKTLITDLLGFAKLKKEVDIIFSKVNLDNLLQNVLFDLKEQIDINEVSISIERLPELSVVPVKLNQLFQNLISNAIKFRKKDRVCTINVSVREQAKHWIFSIKDNGIGIKKEHQTKIFDPFKKLHSSSEFEGSGIGLATCMHIVKLHQGEIWVASNFGEGTTFYFTIAKDLATAQKKKGMTELVEA